MKYWCCQNLYCCCSVAQSYPTLCDSPWTVARQASLSLTISWGLPKFMSIASVRPSSHLILWCPFLLLSSIFPSFRDFANESAVHIRWPKYWSFSISPSTEYLRLTGLISLPSEELSEVFSSTRVQRHQFFGTLPSLQSSSHSHRWLLGNHSLDSADLCQQSNVSAFQHTG